MTALSNWLYRRRIGLRWRFEMAGNRLFDVRYGVETHAVVGLAGQGVSAAEAERGNNIYRPIWASEFRRLMKVIKVNPKNFIFVDFGSGKGKMLLLAAKYGFPKVVGVEYAPSLHAIATENISIFRNVTKCNSTIVAINGNAVGFALPEGPLVMAMFNPFDRDTTRAVIEGIESDHRRSPREMYLLYANRRSVEEIGDAFAGARILRPLKTTSHILLFHAGEAGEMLQREP